MKEFILNLFRENTNESMTRFCLFICTLSACVISFLPIADKISIMGILLGASFTAKVASKSKETKE